MRSSRRWGGCRARVVYLDEPSPGSLLRAGMVAVSALLLSNSIRRWVCVELLVWTEAGGEQRPLTLRIDGSRVRWLRADESSLLGVLRSAVARGGWPGIRVETGNSIGGLDACVDAEEVLAGDVCGDCILVRGQRIGLKPWWLVAATMVAYDERCLRGCRDTEDQHHGLGDS